MTTTSTWMGRLREFWGYFNWLYSPFGRMSAKEIYELQSTRALSRNGIFLNFGY